MADKRLGIGMVGGLPVREAVGYTRAAEEAGISSFWYHETYGLRDALSYIAAAAIVTDRIALGAGCLNPFTRNAALMAMSCAALQELSAGRYTLALGTAYSRLHNLGYSHHFSLSALTEMIGACRRLWWGETLTVTGQVVGLNNMSLQLPRCEVPIYVATKGPKTLKLTAELADGHLDGPMVPAAAMANHKAAIQSVGPKAGFRYAAYIFCSFAGDRPTARASVRSDPFFLYLLQLDQTDFMESGLDPDLRARIVATAKVGDLDRAAMLVPDDVLDRFVLCGTEHEVVDQLGAYVQAGLDEPILQPLKPSPAAFQSAINAGRAYLR